MWWLMLLVLAAPAAAQRPFCDFGQAVGGLRGAEQRLGAPGAGLLAGRAAAGEAAAALASAEGSFSRCQCPHLAELAGEAARGAEIAAAHALAAEVSASIAQARFRAGLARQALERDGCR
jgi:hypothetical protein